jgi:spore coat polysaccharide biosynthesis predicted glycosyltransferase SpsG
MQMIFIRTDFNESIDASHMIRCMTLARELASNGLDSAFLISDQDSAVFLEEEGLLYTVLETYWDNLDNSEEIEKMTEILSDEENPVLIVDSEYVTAEYLKKLGRLAKVVYFDDLFKEKYDVDILINHSICVDLFDYKSRYGDTNIPKRLLGPQYALLRKQFEDINIDRRDNTKTDLDILFICGDGDPLNLLYGIFEFGIENSMFKETDEYHIVIGAYNPHEKELLELSQKYFNINLYRDISNLSDVMEECDVVVAPAGITLYECCAVGVPAISYSMTDDQVNNGKYFMRDAGFIYAGDVRTDRESVFYTIYNMIDDLRNDADMQRSISLKAHKLVDGNGAIRITREILKL